MRKNVPLMLIFMVVFVDLLGFGVLIPILPAFAKYELHAPESAVGLAISIYSLVQFIFNPILGALSDRKGRRQIILVTLLINATGYIIFSFTHSLLLLILSRIVGGIGGSTIGVAQAYIADVTTKEERSKGMGLIGVAFGLGFVLGPLIGGLLSKFGYPVVGYTSASFSVIAFILSVFYLPESKDFSAVPPEGHRKAFDLSAYKKVAKNTSLALIVLMFFALTFSVANIYGTFAIMGTEVYHFSNAQNGYIFGIIGLVGIIVQGGLIRRLTEKFSETKLITIGATFLMIGLGMLPFGGNFTGVAIISIIMSLGSGTLQPLLLSLVSKVAPENEQGAVLGVNQSMASFARMLGPLWGGFAFQYLGYQVPFLTGALVMFLLFVASILFLSKHLVNI
ncbi:MAG: MFS transporter [Ignavibacteria bacterium]|nr:MFS transporter [Ignavibacteria bacterium]